MMRSLYAGISGLRNHQTRMDVIGNNISNVNTTGFKASRVTFQDMLSQTIQGAGGTSGNLGGTNPIQIGLGMGLASIDTIFTDGPPQATGKSTDLAIGGQGFFILGDNQNNKIYTRNGAFDFDTSGNLILPGTGYKVMGWSADGKGVITPDPDAIHGINIPVGSSMPAQVSSTLMYTNNLSSSAKAIGTPTEIAAAALALSNANTLLTTATTNLNAAKTAAGVTPAAITWATASVADTDAGTDLGFATTANTTASDPATLALTPAGALAAIKTALVGAGGAGTAADIAATAAAAAAGATPATIAAAVLAVFNTATTKKADTATALATAATNATAAEQTAAAGIVTNLPLYTAAVKAQAAAAVADAAVNDKTSNQQTSLSVYDTQGNEYNLRGVFEKTGENTWSFTPAGTVVDKNGATVANIVATPSTLVFDKNGKFDKIASTINSITIDPTGAMPVTPATVPPTTTTSPYAGAGSFTIKTPDFSTMTQFGNATTAVASEQDGYAAGTLEKVSIDTTGTVVGKFTNNKTLNLAQVALAVFNNPGGLNKVGSSFYDKSSNSGEPQIGQSNTGGRGGLTPSALEMSNVDLAQQFSDMIVTQRGFQANSKIITTTDTMLEELVNLKR